MRSYVVPFVTTTSVDKKFLLFQLFALGCIDVANSDYLRVPASVVKVSFNDWCVVSKESQGVLLSYLDASEEAADQALINPVLFCVQMHVNVLRLCYGVRGIRYRDSESNMV